MTRKVETEGCSPAPGGAAEDPLQVDTNNNSNINEFTSATHNSSRSHSDSSSTDGNADTKVCLKYALRPRSQHRSLHQFSDEAELECDTPLQRSQSEGRKGSGGGSRKNFKPRILSRYRRKNANARERGRMQQINVAFEALQGVLPAAKGATSPRSGGCSSPRGSTGGGASTLTKITTLRLAAGYIQALQDILDADERGETTDDAGSAYSWLLSSLLQDEEEDEIHQAEETTDHNAWALPYFINAGKRSLPIEVPKMEAPWSFVDTLQQELVSDTPLKPDPPLKSDPPLKRLKHEPQLEYSDDPTEGEITFIYTGSAGLELEHLGPYPSITDSETINLLLDQKNYSIPSYDTILV